MVISQFLPPFCSSWSNTTVLQTWLCSWTCLAMASSITLRWIGSWALRELERLALRPVWTWSTSWALVQTFPHGSSPTQVWVGFNPVFCEGQKRMWLFQTARWLWHWLTEHYFLINLQVVTSPRSLSSSGWCCSATCLTCRAFTPSAMETMKTACRLLTWSASTLSSWRPAWGESLCSLLLVGNQ